MRTDECRVLWRATARRKSFVSSTVSRSTNSARKKFCSMVILYVISQAYKIRTSGLYRATLMGRSSSGLVRPADSPPGARDAASGVVQAPHTKSTLPLDGDHLIIRQSGGVAVPQNQLI